MARYTAQQRRRAGTLTDPTTGQKTRFPIADKAHAQKALQLENTAQPPLTPRERATVERRAARFGVTSAVQRTAKARPKPASKPPKSK